MAIPPRPSVAPPPVSGDAVDKLLSAIGAVASTVEALSKTVEESRRQTAASFGEMKGRIDRIEKNGGRTERERRLDVLAATEADAKIANEQAGYEIGLDETRRNAKKAVELAEIAIVQIADLKTAGRELVRVEEARTVAMVDEEQKKPKLPAKLAALLNLAVVVGYLLLELMKRVGK